MQTEQTFIFNGKPATVRQVGDQLEISGDEFIYELVSLGFRPGRNNTPERLEEILRHIPEKFKRDFWDGFHGR